MNAWNNKENTTFASIAQEISNRFKINDGSGTPKLTAWALIIKKEDYEYQKQFGGEKNRIASKLAGNSIRLE